MRLFSRRGNPGIFSELPEGGRDPTSVGRDIHDQLEVVDPLHCPRDRTTGRAWEVENLRANI